MKRFLIVALQPFLALAQPIEGSLPAEELVEQYCIKCHGGEKMEADIDLRGPYDQVSLLKNRETWRLAHEMIEFGDMPPEEPYFEGDDAHVLADWIHSQVNDVDWSKWDDPGRLSLARLTAIEYRNAIRDIFGIDLKAGEFLGKDPEGNTGFSNDRESLSFSLYAFDDFMREAERAVNSFLNYRRKRWTDRIEMEVAWAQVSDKSTSLSGDKSEVVLKDRNSPFQLNLMVPFAGLFKLDIVARPFGGEPLSGMNLVVNGRRQERIIVEGEGARSYPVILNLNEGLNIVSFGYDPDIAPIIQPKYEPNSVPEELTRLVLEPTVSELPLPAKFEEDKEAIKAWERVNEVIRTYALTQRLVELLLDRGLTDYERNPLAVGTAAAAISTFSRTKVPFNLSAGKIAVYLEIPQSVLEKRIKKEIGFAHSDYQKAVDRYIAAWEKKHPERVMKVPGKIGLDRVEISSHALGPRDRDPEWIRGKWEETETFSKHFLNTLGERAYGRTLDRKELNTLMRIYRRTKLEMRSHEDGIRDALVGLLVSPPFLLRYTDPGRRPDSRISDWELASRLARFLWLSVPDDEMRELARAGRLSDRKTLLATVDRMIDSPRFEPVVSMFIDQWLDLEALGLLENARELDASATIAMRDEPALLLLHIVRENRSLVDLIGADYTFLNASLARHYDISGVSNVEMQRVDLPDDRRGGLLAMGGMHIVTSNPNRTSPVNRGAWIVELILGEELPPAPASVPELNTNNTARTIREELELHRSVKECAGCHSRIDPFGFVLEHYDHLGAWRETERGKPVNASTELPDGTEVDGLSQFREYLIENRKDDLIRNLTERMLEFALGRKVRFTDEATVQKIVAALEEKGYQSRTLIHEIVTSDPFLKQNDEQPLAQKY